ncbi:MAG: flippase [Candidatus Manganitrophaceae bacterium]
MSEIAKRVLQNSILRVGGYAVGAAIHFAVIVLVARYLGAERFGYFAFILALVGVFQLVVDMGIRNILIRDIAVDQAGFAEKLGVAQTLFWILSPISMGLIVLAAHSFSLPEEARQSTYLAGLATIVTFHSLAFSAVLRAFEEMEWDILGFVLHKFLLIGLIWPVTHTDWGMRGVVGAMLAANACQYLYYRGWVTVRHGRVRPSRDLRRGWKLFRESFPLGMAEVLRRLTWQADKLLLASLGTPVAVGLFSAAYKFLEAMNPFTVNLTLPLFPVFSRLARESSMKLFKAYRQSIKFLYAMGTPLAVLLFVFADRIVLLFFGEAYREAGGVLRILAPTVVFLLPTSIYGYLFVALGHQKMYTICVTLSLLVNVVLDLLLIPRFGYFGAAIGTLAAETGLFLAGMIVLQRLGGELALFEMMWRPFLAGLAMGWICWWTREGAPALIGIGVLGGLSAYGALLLLLQTFTRQELALLIGAMRLRIGRVVR